jgi:hypothetical protein
MVPVQLDALVLRQGGGVWADTRMKEPPQEGGPVPRLSLLPGPFADLEGGRKRGVYLHWALPDGLTRGTTPDPHTQATFPQIPDRWLVLRMFPAQDGTPRRGVRGWVLRSGEDQPVVVELDKWTEPGPKQGSKGPLTAMGHGDPAWAAYYDNVVNRLAFYDDLSDISTGPIAYLVCGWYADPKQDPLGTGIHSLTDFDAKMAQLGWELATSELEESHSRFSDYVKSATMVGLPALETFQARSTSSRLPQLSTVAALQVVGSSPAGLDASGHPEGGSYQTNGAWWPSQIVCHGSVVGIGWPGIGFPGSERGLLSGEVGGPPRATDVRVVFGNTLTEALSEQIARTNTSPKEGRVLEAFMLGAMQELDQPDGTSRVDARLHANAFGSLPGGEVEETITIPGNEHPRVPSNPVASKPGIFKRKGAGLSFVHDLPFTQSTVAVAQQKFVSAEFRSEAVITPGKLSAVIDRVAPAINLQDTGPKQVTVKRSLPRRFYPADPVFLLQGCDRSFKHGGDGRFSEDGKLICRLTGFALTEIACLSVGGGPLGRPAITGDDLLLRGVENGSVPPECEDLLRETVLHDPGTAVHAARASTSLQGAQLLQQAQNFMVEQTAWWATRDPRVDHAPLITKSGIAGMLPSAIAVSPPVHPWTPLHLEWKVQYIPSPNGVDDWSLQEIDFHSNDKALPATGDTTSGIILSGRALLTGGVAANVASTVRNALKQAASAAGSEPLKPNQIHAYHSHLSQVLLQAYSKYTVTQADAGGGNGGGVPAIDRSALDDIAGTLANMDVLGGALDNFHARLHDGGIQVRAGFLRILRLRLVDCFGQFLDLAGSGDTTIADPNQLIETEPVSIAGRPDIAALPPRFLSPSRLWFRLMDAATGKREATPDIAPVCGYILPNHLDGDLEFFDPAGTNLGVVRPEPGAGIIWEDAPGLPSTVGASPARAIPNGFLAGVAQGLLDWGVADATAAREDALSALLRIIDSTLWSVDPFGHTGDEHLALLIGHPIAVLRAKVRLEVEEPVDPQLLNALLFPLRLGALTHWQDGLLGYFVNDDYRTLFCADRAVAGFARDFGPGRGFLQPVNLVDKYYQNFANDLGVTVTEGASPVNHPYVEDSGILKILPNQEIDLTLLVEPHAVVHATTGYLPRKEIGMRREWIAPALAAISPTFRFGPLLVDPKRLRMPVANDLHGTWSWDHRLDITTWAEDKVVNTSGDAMMSDDAAKGQEGWLRLTPLAEGK